MAVRPDELPSGCVLRPACSNDLWAIRRLVFSARLDPTQLRWLQFWVVEHQGRLIACGQLRSFEVAQELGSLVVANRWRHQGIGSVLVRHLIQQATQPLYLECLGDDLAQFYQRFGFRPVEWNLLPRSLKQKFGLSTRLARLFHLPLSIMELTPSPVTPSPPLNRQE